MDKENRKNSRRDFIRKNLLLSMGVSLGFNAAKSAPGFNIGDGLKNQPAILGGKPLLHPDKKPIWPKWPVWDKVNDEPGVIEVLRSGVWSRSARVTEFEEVWAKTIGAKRCVTTVNGTNAMICSLVNLDVGGGDEVILPPYTFIATPQAILQSGAMPVFVDIDPETFQMDVNKIEEKITSKTKAILPVHIAGLPCDMENIMKIARKHNLVVIEDACQAWLAEIDHKKVGTFGDAGCFSFQNSKNIPMGEGGAIVSDNEQFIDRCYSYHNYGIAFGSMKDEHGPGLSMLGTKLRLTEYQAAIGLAQLKRLEKQTELRNQNADFLRAEMAKIQGIIPFRLYDNVTRAAYHLYPFRYKKDGFKGLSRALFIRALQAEGVPCSAGYDTLNDKPYLKNAFGSKNFKRMYPGYMLDFEDYKARNHCPQNDIVCKEEAIWFSQNILLGSRSDMDYIIQAIRRIQSKAEDIKKIG